MLNFKVDLEKQCVGAMPYRPTWSIDPAAIQEPRLRSGPEVLPFASQLNLQRGKNCGLKCYLKFDSLARVMLCLSRVHD